MSLHEPCPGNPDERTSVRSVEQAGETGIVVPFFFLRCDPLAAACFNPLAERN